MQQHAQFGEVVAVSRYWTPGHLDVTDAPVRYAAPKAAWIDRMPKRARVRRIDDVDRLWRRRAHSGAIVAASEISVLPALNLAPVDEVSEVRSPLGEIYGAVARRLTSRRLAT
ncbi:hypothetical protein WPS_08860 [Vulcanimicrobium alpinum]|uniref:Uncharacterized protein n=1 Tax=Vulcanimicrobium alpinum TaxID=3016050 RepID=A0AAN2C8K2_UNVUL|nr:hypothetical protein [Vulcanimicrobium alpinum]BDE05610.1 hypothetical protein WPS_08860 [Vulcanimicrobium alpinum]